MSLLPVPVIQRYFMVFHTIFDVLCILLLSGGYCSLIGYEGPCMFSREHLVNALVLACTILQTNTNARRSLDRSRLIVGDCFVDTELKLMHVIFMRAHLIGFGIGLHYIAGQQQGLYKVLIG